VRTIKLSMVALGVILSSCAMDDSYSFVDAEADRASRICSSVAEDKLGDQHPNNPMMRTIVRRQHYEGCMAEKGY